MFTFGTDLRRLEQPCGHHRYLGHRGGGLGGLRGAMFALLAAVQILARANDYGEWAAPGVLE
jgi:hypothetical protein